MTHGGHGEVVDVGCTADATISILLPPAGVVVAASISLTDIQFGDEPCPVGWSSGNGSLTGTVLGDGGLSVTGLNLFGVEFGPVDIVRRGPELVAEFAVVAGGDARDIGSFVLQRR